MAKPSEDVKAEAPPGDDGSASGGNAKGDDDAKASPPPTKEGEDATSDDAKPKAEDAEDEEAKASDDDAAAPAGEEETFPQQLLDVLDKETGPGGVDTREGKRVLEWNDAGDAFIIRDKALLEKEVLPKHFTTRSKAMSFIRKLYRWGFRQDEKTNEGWLTFTHDNFKRGDKQRCLKMRSIVKNSKQASPAPLPMSAYGGMGGMMMPGNMAMLQAFGAGAGSYGGGMGMSDMMRMGGGMNPYQFNPQMFGGMMNQGGGMGGMGGMSSSDMYQAMQQQQMQQQMMMGMSSMQPPPQGGAAAEAGGGESTGTGDLTELELATEIMRREPSMDPRRALELAKQLRNK